MLYLIIYTIVTRPTCMAHTTKPRDDDDEANATELLGFKTSYYAKAQLVDILSRKNAK